TRTAILIKVLRAIRQEELRILVLVLIAKSNIAIELQLLDRFGGVGFRQQSAASVHAGSGRFGCGRLGYLGLFLGHFRLHGGGFGFAEDSFSDEHFEEYVVLVSAGKRREGERREGDKRTGNQMVI